MSSRAYRIGLPLLGLVLVVALILEAKLFAQSAAPPASSAPQRSSRIVAEGRRVAYPGAHSDVGSEIAGVVERVVVTEKTAVRQGDLLVELRADDLRAALAEAEAQLAEADADIRLAESEVARATRLASQQVGPVQDVDRRERDVAAASARQKTAAAAIRRWRAALAKTRILAPIDGVVIERHVEPGEALAPGTVVISLVDLNRTRIEAEVDEFDAGRVSLGAAATIRAEGFAEAWSGTVEEIPDVVGFRRLKPQDPGRPTDTRVLAVKIALATPTPIKLGQRVEVEIAVP